MRFNVVDSQTIYRQLLATDEDDTAARDAIFDQGIITPFAELTRYFGGDSKQAFSNWGMSADHFRAAHW